MGSEMCIRDSPNSGRHALAGLRKGVDVATDFGELVYLSQKVIDIMGGA